MTDHRHSGARGQTASPESGNTEKTEVQRVGIPRFTVGPFEAFRNERYG